MPAAPQNLKIMNQESMLTQEAQFKKAIVNSPWIECDAGNKTFQSKTIFKKISALLSPTGQPELFPFEVHICDKCGKVPKFIAERLPELPEELIADCGNEQKGTLILS